MNPRLAPHNTRPLRRARTLAARYRALAGSIKVGQRWLAEKRAALSGLQSLNKTERDLAGMRS